MIRAAGYGLSVALMTMGAAMTLLEIFVIHTTPVVVILGIALCVFSVLLYVVLTETKEGFCDGEMEDYKRE